MLGPHVVRALEGHHELRLTDVVDIDSAHDHLVVDVGSLEEVTEAAAGGDAIVNCSVSRRDRRLAFDVNARGCYNAMSAAVEHGVRRVVNTGPRFSLLGPSYLDHDFGLGPDVPPQSGTGLYPISKSLGQEICRVFAENHDVYVVYLGCVDICIILEICQQLHFRRNNGQRCLSFFVGSPGCTSDGKPNVSGSSMLCYGLRGLGHNGGCCHQSTVNGTASTDSRVSISSWTWNTSSSTVRSSGHRHPKKRGASQRSLEGSHKVHVSVDGLGNPLRFRTGGRTM